MIDIIIPAYNAHETIERTILSICYQTICDKVKVYIINDASDKDYKEFVNKYSKYININEIDLDKNGGPGVARETGLKNSNSEFIVFIDADDTFASPIAIQALYDSIIRNDLDVLVGSFSEIIQDGERIHSRDNTWLHGKIYRRSFIENNNIHFNNTRANEDSYFNQCISIMKPRMDSISDIVYYWNNNSKSITRKNNYEYSHQGMNGYIYNMEQALEFAINNKVSTEIIANKSIIYLQNMYYKYLVYKDDEFLKLSKRINDIYKEYKNNITSYDEIIKSKYDQHLEQYPYIDEEISKLSFEEFLKKVNKYD